MQRRSKVFQILGASCVAALVVFMAGCCSVEPTSTAASVKPAPPPLPSSGCPVMGRQGGNLIARQAIPTGKQASSVVMLEKIVPEVVNVGQEFEYTINVTNLTECELDEVMVTETVADGLTYKGSTPNASKSGDLLTWDLGALAGNGTETVKVRVVADGPGTFTDCARVTYKEKLCLTVKAVQPKLMLDKSAPADVLLCDLIPIKLTVRNPGSGAANNVVITDRLPAGMKTVDGKSSVRIDVGTLAPGEQKEYTVNCQATKTGSFDNQAVVNADGGLSDEANTTTVVRQPVLEISKTASEMVYEGRPIKYTIKVDNTGDAASANTVLTDAIPSGTSFVSASDGGQFAGGTITWNLGTLASKASKTVNATVTAVAQGNQVNRAEVKGTCAEAVADTATTRVEGIAAILLEVVDIADPIEVGGQETYVITATNQGSKVGTNIQITCTLEDPQTYVSSSGATSATASGQKITFAPLSRLAPKDKAEWRVVVKAQERGDIRFAVELTSDQLERPVNETESTHQY